MIYDLKTIKEQYFANQKKSTKNSDSQNFFSFSKLKDGDNVRIRFVEDTNDNSNIWFGRKRATRKLVFNSAISNGKFFEGEVVVEVPAFNLKKGETDATLPEEYKFTSEEDTIQQLIGPLWDGTEKGQTLYRKFKRKETFLYQGFIHSEGYETKLYRFLFTTELNKIIESCMNDEQMDLFKELPCYPEKGRDFILKAERENNRRKYSSSTWALSSSPLTDAERKYLEENGSYPLLNYIPKKPTQEQLQVMADMFHAICNEEPYNFDTWGTIFKPNNCYKDSDGNVKFRYSTNESDDSSEEIKSVASFVETPSTSTIQPPEKISTVELNNAMAENSVTVDNKNVNDLVANLMSQFG